MQKGARLHESSSSVFFLFRVFFSCCLRIVFLVIDVAAHATHLSDDNSFNKYFSFG